MRTFFAGIFLFASAAALHAETIQTKYCGAIDTASFECKDITRSSFIMRVCYDAKQSMILLNLKGVYYCKCNLPASKFDEFMNAPSMGEYFNTELKGGFHCIGIDRRFPK